MFGIDEFRKAKDPRWRNDAVHVVKESNVGGRKFRQLSDGSVVVQDKDRLSVSLPDGVTIHQTDRGLQINHGNGVVAQIEERELHLGDGLSFKYYGVLERIECDDRGYAYETRLNRIVLTNDGFVIESRQ